MKKIVSLGLMVLLTMSVGCSKSEEAPTSPASSDVPAVATEVTATEGNPVTDEASKIDAKILSLKDDDFKDFFKAVFSYTENEYKIFNQNVDMKYVGYFDNLEAYKKGVEMGLGKFLSEDLLKELKSQNTKLDFDLPKKVLVNDYVVEAQGEVEQVKIETTRQLGDSIIYGVAVTTSNKIIPVYDFIRDYGWSNELGYYELKSSGANLVSFSVETHKENPPTYIYSASANVTDHMKMISHYWVQVGKSESSTYPYVVEGLKEAGAFEVDYDVKQQLINNQYVERVPYYEEATDSQKKLMNTVFSTLLSAPKETYYYYEKVMKGSFDQYMSFWNDLNLASSLLIDQKNYKTAFNATIIPYTDNIAEMTLNEKTMKVNPSIYSTELQPTFLVTLPVKALLKDNSVVYYNYKYFVSTENNKVEAIQFIKMDDITQEEYDTGVAPVVEQAQQPKGGVTPAQQPAATGEEAPTTQATPAS